MGTNGPRWGWGFIKHQLSGPHYRDRIMQCAQYPFYHFLPSCIPILLSISTNFSPSPLPPSSILKKRCVSLILYSGCQEELTWHQVLQDAANPPISWFPKCSQSVDENQDLWCRAPKEEIGWVPWWILCFNVPQWSVQCCYTSCTACPETCTCHGYDPALCTWGKGTLLGLGSSGVTALARQLVPWLEPLHWLELILLLLLGPSCPSLPPGN